jgi:hypothetical protein
MGGGLIQLVSYGTEDLYLTDNPEITFFKCIYKRHTNFAIEPVKQLFSGKPDFGEKVTCTISKNGDLMGKTYLVVDLPSIPENEDDLFYRVAWVKNIGYNLINKIEIEIGGQLLDRQYGDYMAIWNELTSKNDRIDKLVGNLPNLYEFSKSKDSYKLHIPLTFWFCNHSGLTIPLVALQYSSVKIHIEFNTLKDCLRIGPINSIQTTYYLTTFKYGEKITQTINGITNSGLYLGFDITNKQLLYIPIKGTFNIPNNSEQVDDTTNENYAITGVESKGIMYPLADSMINNIATSYPNISLSNTYLLVNYYYLDNFERIKFAKANHEYLIEQVQLEGDKNIFSNSYKTQLGFSHPCKELIFRCQMKYFTDGPIKEKNIYINPDSAEYNLVKKIRLLLNGQERFPQREDKYFELLQAYQYHSHKGFDGVYVYSFCLKPEDYQPSGSINFSKIDDIVLELQMDKEINVSNPAKLRVYCINFNVIRIINGLCGLAFSN